MNDLTYWRPAAAFAVSQITIQFDTLLNSGSCFKCTCICNFKGINNIWRVLVDSPSSIGSNTGVKICKNDVMKQMCLTSRK